MPDDFRPRHLRGIPASRRAELPPERNAELMDLQTDLDRDRRRREAGRDPAAPEPWGFPVPRPMALLFDRLPSPFTVRQAMDEGAALRLDAGDVSEALEAMRRHELVSDAPAIDGEAAYVRHPENRNRF